MTVQNPGAPRTPRKGKKMPKATKKKNPKRTPAQKRATARMIAANRAKRNPRKTSAKRKTAKNPKRSSAKRPKSTTKRSSKRNPKTEPPKKGRRKTRRRRSNPGWGNVKVVAMGLGVGVLTAIGSAWINDRPLGNQPPNIQAGAVIVEGVAAIYWFENPVFAVGAVVGLALVPFCQFIYQRFPMLAGGRPDQGQGPPPAMVAAAGAAAPALPAAAGTVAASGAPTMSALHRGRLRALRIADRAMMKTIGALHGDMAALHQGMGALHHGSAMPVAMNRGGAMNGTMRALHRGMGR